jgi:hypothetical protein
MSKFARVLGSCQADPAKKAGSRTHTSKKGSQTQPVFNPGDWITQATAARTRHVSRQAIAKLIRKGKFSTLVISGRVFLKRSEVEEYKPNAGGRPRRT